ncbi:hypothetical protein [Desulfamplus magnetovallimortis]|nr:hypothetical protein [Desulfamplus magnetovallimortis]
MPDSPIAINSIQMLSSFSTPYSESVKSLTVLTEEKRFIMVNVA